MTDTTHSPTENPSNGSGGGWTIVAAIAAVVSAIAAFVAFDWNRELTVRLSSYEASYSNGSLVLAGGGADFVTPDLIEVAPIWPLDAGIELSKLNGEIREFSGGQLNRDKGTIQFNDIVGRVCGQSENVERCRTADPKALRVTVHIHGKAQDVDIVELP